MIQSSLYPRTSLFFKLAECLLTAVGLISILLVFVEIIVVASLKDDGIQTANQYEEYGLLGTVILAILSAIIYAWIWHRHERAGVVQSGLRHAWIQAAIRYWLAFEISTYGFAKILRTQFETPTYRLDMPLESVSGMALTWYYYGYSYTLGVIIALFQIGGSILLLYRRTTLLGVMVLLPVMVNIVLINVIFGVTSGALFNSIVFTMALLFLLSLDLAKLKAAFWDLVERLPTLSLGNKSIKPISRILPIVAAFTIIYFIKGMDKSDTVLKGTWKVERLTRNGRVVPATAWLNDVTAWNRVYFSGFYGCAFSPNPYRYEPDESWRGSYKFDNTTNKLQAVSYMGQNTPGDTLQATLLNRTLKSMTLRGIINGDSLDMQLTRLR